MLRRICVLAGTGLLLAACSGDGEKAPGPSSTDPDACEGGCGAGEVCGDSECRPACRLTKDCDDGSSCRDGACYPVVCGDEIEEGDEECDNGDRNGDTAACTEDCLTATCGDGLVRSGREECDEGSDNADDGACTETCEEARCGDGLVWAGHEECDEGSDNAEDGSCTNQCVAARCGDGLVWLGHEECDDGNQRLDDACPDGPGGSCELGPNPATELAWQQGSHTNVTAPVATWQPSTSARVVAQRLQLFSDDGCAEASGNAVPVPSTSSASLAVPVTGEGSYTFQIITRDSDAKETTSLCSPVLLVDTTPPEPATALGFAESSPHDRLTVHGTWTASPSTDLGGQSLQLYGGGVCASTIGSPVDVGSPSAERYPIVTPTDATYSFKVISRDLAGNSAVSSCSPAMQTSAGDPYRAKFNGDLPQAVVQVRIDPKNAATLYVTLGNGEIRKSTDAGSSWTPQCVSSNIAAYGGTYGHIRVSPDGSAYATGHTQFVRVEALNGAECPVIISNSAAWASYYHSNRLAIDSTGRLYTWTFTDPAGLVTSIDKGDHYDAINTTPSLFNSMEVDPHDDKHLVAVFSQHSTSPEGIHHSVNGGLNWTPLDATFDQYQGGIRFNPAVAGWIYLQGGRYSKDGGSNWATNASFDCLELDASGAGYRLVAAAGSTSLQRASDMTSPAWSTIHTFTGVEANLGVSMVSVVGSSIAVVLEGSLYVSTNAGSSFTPVKLLVTDGSLVASSIVAHGSLVYAAAGGRIFESVDAADSWSEVYAPASALDADTELHLNPGVVAQLVARPERWNSTYEERVDVTLDGAASWSSTTDCCYGWAGVVALDAADASRILYFGYEPRVSSDGGLSFTETSSSGQLVWDPWPAAFVNPSNSGQAWYGESSGRLYEYNLQGNQHTNITSRLPFTDPAGMDLIELGNAWQLRVVSRTGKIAVSLDNGKSFTAVAGSGGLPSADRRIFVSHPSTPNLIATAPLLGDEVAYSPTLGASWVQTPLDDCEIRGLALTDGQLLIPCADSAAMAIAAP
jgi:hypothetical protein